MLAPDAVMVADVPLQTEAGEALTEIVGAACTLTVTVAVSQQLSAVLVTVSVNVVVEVGETVLFCVVEEYPLVPDHAHV